MAINSSDLQLLRKLSDDIGYESKTRKRVCGLLGSAAVANMNKWDLNEFLKALREALNLNLDLADEALRPSVIDVARLSPDLVTPIRGGERFTIGDYEFDIYDVYPEEVKKKFYALVERVIIKHHGGEYIKARKEFSKFTFTFDIMKSFKFTAAADGYTVAPCFGQKEVDDAFSKIIGDKRFATNDYSALMQLVDSLGGADATSIDAILHSVVRELTMVDDAIAPTDFGYEDYGKIYRTLKVNREKRGRNPALDVLSKMFVARFPVSELDPCVKIAEAIHEARVAEGGALNPEVVLVLANGHEDSIRELVKLSFPKAKKSFYTLAKDVPHGYIAATKQSFISAVVDAPHAAVISDGLLYVTEKAGSHNMSHAAPYDVNEHQWILLMDYDERRPFVISTLHFPYSDTCNIREDLEEENFRVVQSPTRHSAIMVGFYTPTILNMGASVVSQMDDIVFRSGIVDRIRQWVFDNAIVPPDSIIASQLANSDSAPYLDIVRQVKLGIKAPPLVEGFKHAPPVSKKRSGLMTKFLSGKTSEDETVPTPTDTTPKKDRKTRKDRDRKRSDDHSEKPAPVKEWKKTGKTDAPPVLKETPPDKRVYGAVSEETGKISLTSSTAPRHLKRGTFTGFDRTKTALQVYLDFQGSRGIHREEALKNVAGFKKRNTEFVDLMRNWLYSHQPVTHTEALGYLKGVYGDLGIALYVFQLSFSVMEIDAGKFKLNIATQNTMDLKAFEGSGAIGAEDYGSLLD
jgi:hypothetical protein